MVRGPTDEHRFVGLMMLPKLLERSDSTTDAASLRKAAFDALDLQFVGRLLTSRSGENASQMRAVALAVLSAFAGEPQFSKNVVALAKCLGTTLALEGAVEQPDLKIVKDIHGTLQGVALSARSSLALVEAGGTVATFKLLVALDRAATEHAESEQHSSIMTKLGQGICAVLTAATTCTSLEHQTQELASSSFETVALVAAELGASTSFLKFVALKIFSPALALLPQQASPVSSPLEPTVWVADVRNGLYNILSSRIGMSERYAALLAVATLCEYFCDSSWLFDDSDGKLSQVVMRLVSVELQLLLEDDRTSISNEQRHERQGLVNPSDMLSVCFRLSEIAVLRAQTRPPGVDGAPDTSTKHQTNKDNKERHGAGGAEQETIGLAGDCVRSVIQWLARLMTHEQSLAPLLTAELSLGEEERASEIVSSQPTSEPPPQQQRQRKSALLLGGVRLVGCWAAAAEPQLEIARIIPFLLRDVWAEGVDSRGVPETGLQPGEQLAFDFLYPALLQMSVASPISRRWLFSNPPQDLSLTSTDATAEIGAGRSVAASVAMQLVRDRGNLESRRLEFLLNLLCLEQADGFPGAVAAAIGEAAEVLAKTLQLKRELSVDVALAIAFVAGSVRLLRDSKQVPSATLRSLCMTGCNVVVQWVVASYSEVVKVARRCLEEPIEAESAREIPELWSLTCGILCSLLGAASGGDSTRCSESATLVVTSLRAGISECQQLLCDAKTAAHKESRRPIKKSDEDEDEDSPATTPITVAQSLLVFADCLG